MDTETVIRQTIKDHPFIEFDNSPGLATAHWGLCPCGFATRHFKTRPPVLKAFETHVAQEVNEALQQHALLSSQPKIASSTIPRKLASLALT